MENIKGIMNTNFGKNNIKMQPSMRGAHKLPYFITEEELKYILKDTDATYKFLPNSPIVVETNPTLIDVNHSTLIFIQELANMGARFYINDGKIVDISTDLFTICS